MDKFETTALKSLGKALIALGIGTRLVIGRDPSPSLHFYPDYGANTVTIFQHRFLFRTHGGKSDWMYKDVRRIDECANAIAKMLNDSRAQHEITHKDPGSGPQLELP